MKPSSWIHLQRARSAACLLAGTTIAAVAFPQLARAAQVQAYVIFEIAASPDAGEKLRSTSLRNCLQLVIGKHARDVFVHVACDGDFKNLNDALQELSKVDGISRATLVSIKPGAN